MITSLLTHFAACTPSKLAWLPTWYKYLPQDTSDKTRCTVTFNPANGADIGKILLAIVDILLRIGAIVAIGYVIYGGIQYILSQGEPDKISGARQTITNAIIGLVIAMLATGIVTLVGNTLVTR